MTPSKSGGHEMLQKWLLLTPDLTNLTWLMNYVCRSSSLMPDQRHGIIFNVNWELISVPELSILK